MKRLRAAVSARFRRELRRRVVESLRAVDRTSLPGADESFRHSGLTNGLLYYYAAFTHDDAGRFSTAVTVGPAQPAARPDFDRDGDVDQSDFGHLQVCLGDPQIQQTDPSCRNTKFNADNYNDRCDIAFS